MNSIRAPAGRCSLNYKLNCVVWHLATSSIDCRQYIQPPLQPPTLNQSIAIRPGQSETQVKRHLQGGTFVVRIHSSSLCRKWLAQSKLLANLREARRPASWWPLCRLARARLPTAVSKNRTVSVPVPWPCATSVATKSRRVADQQDALSAPGPRNRSKHQALHAFPVIDHHSPSRGRRSLLGRSLWRHQLVRHSRQANYDHAERFAAGPSYTRGTRLNLPA